MEEEDEQEIIEAKFAVGHADRAHDFILLAEEELSNSVQPWTTITFGLGLLDLGRRDVQFNPDQLEDLPELKNTICGLIRCHPGRMVISPSTQCILNLKLEELDHLF